MEKEIKKTVQKTFYLGFGLGVVYTIIQELIIYFVFLK